MKLRTAALAAALCLGALAPAHAEAPARSSFGTIHATVYWYGVPKPGAVVLVTNCIIGASKKTDSHGVAEFDVPDGFYLVGATGSKAWFPWWFEPCWVERGKVTHLIFNL